MKVIDAETREKLRKPFPPEAIKQHPTKKFLSTIKAMYILERLNDVFGIGVWDIEHEVIYDSPEYVCVKGRLKIGEPWDISTPYQYGGHTKVGTNTEIADGYKSAVTDCLSKNASYLEVGIDVFKGHVNGSIPSQPAISSPQAEFNLEAKIGGNGKNAGKTWAEVDISYLEKCKDFDKLPAAFRDKCKKAIELRLPQAEIKEPEKAQPKKAKKSEPTYRITRGDLPWIFLVHKSIDGKKVAIYNVNMQDNHCNCASRVPCKHIPMVKSFIAKNEPNKPIELPKEETEGKGRGEQETSGNGGNKGNGKPTKRAIPAQLQAISKVACQKVINAKPEDISETLEGRNLTLEQANMILEILPKIEGEIEISEWLKKIAAVCETI